MEEKEIEPVAFAISLGIKPFPYQIDFLLDDSSRIIFVAGRQTGKTTMTAIKGLYFALRNPDSTILVVAPTWRQSNILFNKMQSLILATVLDKEVEHMTKTTIYFKNGSKIYCLPSGQYGDTIRGFTADLIIFDEGAYIPEEVYVAVEPALATKNGTLILIGTPAGKTGRFWEAWISDNFSKHHATSYDNPLISREFLEEQKLGMTENQFRQEYLAEFIEEQDLFFPLNLIDKNSEDIWKTEPEEGRTYILGVDVARFGTDETALVVLEKGNPNRIVYYETYSKKPITHTVGKIKDLNRKWKFHRIIVDETGLGGGSVDLLKEELENVKGVTLTAQRKEEIYNNLKKLFETGEIRIPNDRKLRLQFSSIEYEYTSAGHLKIKKPGHGEGIIRHADLVDAIALACYSTLRKSYDEYKLPDESI